MASLKESLSKGITTINVKTNSFMEESKCKTYISTLEKEIQILKQNIGETMTVNIRYCANCGAQNAANYKFCSKCGSPLN